ncbi:hypothetical protein Xmau_02633 [Xenorhabdus mauleonii]|uniref:Uncharacterized protein n=1 Tax=Xenorhabdus mauleonii TaxID=351675 RepID=A0A1I3ULR1_9GAMM|nr:hypothetical protein [Xenorhabdus mauleonii]PHM39625.1 hypothetical protein Xmau_02633 [Xenorhabdus mauleonii]SFJ84424.1 hypothetical protein SAMN05421680_11784 [Xenorhabdus mauleonii]
MPIPQRLKPYKPNEEEFARMESLLTQIEDKIFDHKNAHVPEIQELINEWNKNASREFEFHEFRDLHSYTDNESFIYSAFYKIKYIADLGFDEAMALVNIFSENNEHESDVYYAINLLEENFPDTNISDLIFWPDDWFQNETFEAELTSEEILGYAMARSGRFLPDAPEIELKYPIPQQ